ncbi:calcium-binding protein [Rhodobacter ferrooxidans]|uniref:Na-Ca exchanger/integrin-beta4 n=1 Tax=Rhodobacter ferrooxidans TaxID=371731 RepID=C8S3W7_9RHOB|nr:calcium-binding protein [Rhodobacter sp. SW2]EEW24336.1 Na-Ca exchanger/integrin-beta4 [Rhodobacter sp. SW2]
MPTYESYFLNSVAGSNVNWLAGTVLFPQMFTNLVGTLAAIVNADGTWTVFHGDLAGFSFDVNGNLQGTIRWITHTTPGGLAGFAGAFELESVGGAFDHLNIDVGTFMASSAGARYDLMFNRPGMVFNGDAGDNLLGGGVFADVFNGMGGTDTVSYIRAALSVVADLEGTVAGVGEGAGDVFNGIANLTGSDHAGGDQLFGTAGVNVIYGLWGNDLLSGRGGNDTLEGGGGDDTLIGGTGSDLLNGGDGDGDELNYSDMAANLSLYLSYNGGGTVLVSGTGDFDTFTGMEYLQSGSGNDNLTGNQYANRLTGGSGNDTLFGSEGNDTLFGGLGNDYLIGGSGTDIVHGGGGIDILAFNNGEIGAVNLVIDDTGTGFATTQGTGSCTFDGITQIVGSFGNDTISGNILGTAIWGDNGNDRLLGRGGNDGLDGGAGNDSLWGDNDWGLQGGNEDMGDDSLNGNDGDDRMFGGQGNDHMDGGAGIDTADYSGMFDDYGNGEYFIVANLGLDRVDKYYFDYFDGLSYLISTDTVLGSGAGAVENLVGTAAGDRLEGSSGNNALTGGGGADTFVITSGGGHDRITDLGLGGADVVTVGSNATLTASLAAAWTATAASSNFGVANINTSGLAVNLAAITLGSGWRVTNSGFATHLTGSAAGDTLSASTRASLGVDTLTGGLGDDIYVTNGDDQLVELAGQGLDRVASSGSYTLAANVEYLTLTGRSDINGTGNALDNVINGNIGVNTLNGGTGTDTLAGGLGNDTYITDGGDILNEGVGAGIDRVLSSATYALAANIENLVLTGTAAINGSGNALDNIITGNAASNILSGTGGADTLVGGLGDDIYVTDGSDILVEAVGAGLDRVASSVTYILAANLEYLTLTGTAAINATGNALSNILNGNAGANTLNGAGGNDTMAGGQGDDIYVVDGGDSIVEAAGAGLDRVASSNTYTLAANLEYLTLTGTAAINGSGNALDNIVNGNAGANILGGDIGNDTLSGGAGADIFIFNTAPGVGNIDRITDFAVIDDMMAVGGPGFAGLAAGGLAASAFAANLTGLATDALQRILYETDTGRLMFDADGNGAAVAVQFATLGTGLALTEADFFVL